MVCCAIRRVLLFPVCILAGVAAVLWLSGFWARIPIDSPRYQAFTSPPAPLPETVRWTSRTARIALPDSGWRPVAIDLTLQATPDAGDGAPVTVEVGGTNRTTVDGIGSSPQPVRIVVDRDRAGTKVPLNLKITPSGGGIGVVAIHVTPLMNDRALGGMLATGFMLGLCAWLGFAGPWRRRGLLLTAAALGFLACGAGAFGFRTFIGGGLRLVGLWSIEGVNVTVLLFLLLFPGWFILDLARRRLPDAIRDARGLLALPASALLIGLVTVLLEFVRAPNYVFVLSACGMYALPLATLIADAGRRRRAWTDLCAWRFALLLPALVSVCAICYAGVGLSSFDSVMSWARLADRNVMPLPADNELNWLASQTWRLHLPANSLFYYPWRIGDRGPLLALLHVFLSRVLELNTPTYANYTRLGIVLNSMFLAPLFIWLSAILGRRLGWLCAALVGLNPWFFLNIYFTWPKLFSVYFTFVAMWLFWRRSVLKTPALFATLGLLLGLSTLPHAGAILSVPVFLLITQLAFIRSWRRTAPSLLWVAAAFAVVAAPWHVYKALYSPESYSLFYLHYFDGKGYFTPFSENAARFFAEHPKAEQIAVRLANVRELWWTVLARDRIFGFWQARDVGLSLYVSEFFSPWYTTGAIWGVWGAVAIVTATVVATMRKTGSGVARWFVTWFGATVRGHRDVLVWPAVVFVAISLTINQALRWAPPHSHELPYFELVLLAALILIGLARLGRAWLVPAIVAVVVRQAFYFHQSARASRLELPAMDGFGRLYWITLAAILLIALLPATASPSAEEPRQ